MLQDKVIDIVTIELVANIYGVCNLCLVSSSIDVGAYFVIGNGTLKIQ